MQSTAITDATELVVPLDGEEGSVRAVPIARSLALRLGLGVRLFSAGGDTEELGNWMRDIAERHLEGTEATIDVAAAGDPASAIVGAAQPGGLVCMATAGSLRPHGGHVGSVAEHVVREIGRPVVLAGPEISLDPRKRAERVIVPVDGSKLSESAVGVAGDLARLLAVPVWVVTVITPHIESEAESQLGGMSAVNESGYVSRIARTVATDFGVEAEFEVLHMPDEARAIVDFAGDDGTVVMSTHGRSGLSRLFGGSVSTAVVAHSQRAVIVWRPEEAAAPQ